MNPDFVDLLRALCGAEARFLVVGAYAELVRNKRAVGRPRDLADLEALGERP